jgi:hypothetical protein
MNLSLDCDGHKTRFNSKKNQTKARVSTTYHRLCRRLATSLGTVVAVAATAATTAGGGVSLI